MPDTLPRAASEPSGRPERPYSGVAAAQRAAARRQRFVEAGIELFGTVGYHATTVRMLTAEAGLTNRYFYESFETTEDLLVACYEQLTGDYRRRLARVLARGGQDVEQRTRAGLRCFFQAMRDDRFARITHGEVLGVSARIDALYKRATAEFAALMMDALGRAGVPVDTHDPREMDVVGAALVGAVIHAGLVWVGAGCRPRMDVVVDATMKVILGTVGQLRAGR